MTRKQTSIFCEKLILAAFPMALAVGCASTTQSESISLEGGLSDEAAAVISGSENPEPKLDRVHVAEDRNSDGMHMTTSSSNADINASADGGDAMTFDAAPLVKAKDDFMLNTEDGQPAAVEQTSEITETVAEADSDGGEQAIQQAGDDVVDEQVLAQSATNEENAMSQPVSISKPSQPEQLTFYFDVNKASVKGDDHEALKRHAEYLGEHPEKILTISGHTDNQGPSEYNEALSEKRANQVAELLISYGAPESQIQVYSFGEDLPRSDADNLEENRRVELLYGDNYMLSAW